MKVRGARRGLGGGWIVDKNERGHVGEAKRKTLMLEAETRFEDGSVTSEAEQEQNRRR